jgi:PHP family Zn ribbon phosphoesterase
MVKNIYAVETGLSSDPPMNWRISWLDNYTLVSFSDSHSPYPYRLGREAVVFNLSKPSYREILEALKNKDPSKILMTIAHLIQPQSL